MSDHLDGMALIRAERQRQIEVEGWTPEHDREHGRDLLTRAANAYRWGDYHYWPWNRDGWKPKDHLSNLIRAGALYMAANEAADLDPESGSLVGLIAGEIDGILAKARAVLAAPVSSVPQGIKSVLWGASDRRDVRLWLLREADQRVRYFPQRRDGVDALLRHLAASLLPVDAEGSED